MKTYHVLIYTPRPVLLRGRATADVHEAYETYWRGLLEDGRLVMAGPYMDESCRMLVLNVADAEEARAILADDPAIQGGLFNGQVQPWTVALEGAG